MSHKHSFSAKHDGQSKYILLFIGLLFLSGSYIAVKHFYGLHDSRSQNSAQAITTNIPITIKKAMTNYALPVRLQIPKILVDSQVKYVGITKDGNMSMPTTVYDVGWYKYGALPGNIGTAVIAGHLDGLNGHTGVFSNLSKLTKGDKIIVTESNGLSIGFLVRETRNYPQNAQPSEVFNSNDGSHLNLITCTGEWDSAVNSFAQRLVVFADKAS